MNYALKRMVDVTLDVCDSIDESGYGLVQHGIELRNALNIELVKFIMYLSASDGTIKMQEAQFISDYLGFNLTPAEINTFIVDNEIYSTGFESTLPAPFTCFADGDRYILENGGEIDIPGVQLLYDLYETLGKEFLVCDGDASDREIEDFTIFTTMLKKFVDEQVASYHPSYSKPLVEEAIDLGLIKTEPEKIEIEEEETLETLLSELNALTGLQDVKKDVNSLINLLRIQKIREERGLNQMPMSLHLVFSGNPGTGKTTVARLLAKIYHKLGVLSKGHLVEVDRSGLVGGYVGQTAIKVQEVIQKSLGGILFIDEAYSLTANRGESDYGIEAVDTLLKGMEDHRDDLIVIVAGYPDLMNEFLNSNPGLRSRFNKFINFVDYTPEELVEIFKGLCKKAGYTATTDCMEYVKTYFEKRYLTRNVNFANGRDVRNFFELAMVNQANRLSDDFNISNDELTMFTFEDVKDIMI